MADGGDGCVGRCEVVAPRRGNRRWPDDLNERSNAIGSREIANGLWRKVSSPERGLWMSRGGMGWLPISLSIGGVLRVRVF